MGWVTAEGKFYPCGVSFHTEALKDIPEEEYLGKPMVKISRSCGDYLTFFEGHMVTRKQRETLFDLCAEEGLIFEEFTILLKGRFE